VPVLACGVSIALAGWSRSAGALLLVALALGCALAALRLTSVRESALAAGARRGADAVLDGKVLDDPRIENGAERFVLGVSAADIDGFHVRIRERAWVSVRPPPRVRLEAGDRVRTDVRLGLLLAQKLKDEPAARSAAARLLRRGVAARAYASPDGVRRIGSGRGPLEEVARAGRRAARRAAHTLPERERGLFLGVTIGDTSLLDPAMEQDFRTTGLTHLLAVSGANLALFLGAVGLVLRVTGAGRRTSVAALALSLIAFMAITRFEPSVLRAGAMSGLALAGIAIGARREASIALAAAALGLLLYDPFLVHSIGFQLSALATLGILALGPRLVAALPRGKLGAAAAVTLAAQLAVTPLIALHFHQVSLIALLANLMAMPAVGPATVLGLVAAMLGALWAPLANAAGLAWPSLAWMGLVARTLARVPLAAVSTPAGAWALAVTVGLGALAIASARVRRPGRVGPVAVCIALVVAAGTWAGALAPPLPAGLVMTAFDVGQGDATLVRDSSGRTMLVDGGPDPTVALRKLARARVGRIDLLVLTHGHADHVNGLVAVARSLRIGRAIDPGIDTDLASYREYVEALARRRIARDVARAGMRYRLGTAAVDVIAPAQLLSGTDSDLNNNSVAVRVSYGSASILLSGEVQEEGQDALLAHPELLRATVFKVPHHGSPRFVPAFYAASHARFAVISVGVNSFGHPSPASLATLRLAGMNTLRTDERGDVTIGLDGRGGVSVRTVR
jgi:competence protein ComEC